MRAAAGDATDSNVISARLRVGRLEFRVIGDEPVVVIDWFGASNYGKGHA